MSQNPEFESKHPRADGGRFAEKEKLSAGIALAYAAPPDGISQEQWTALVQSCYRGTLNFRSDGVIARDDLVALSMTDIIHRAEKDGSWDRFTPEYAYKVARGYVTRAITAIREGRPDIITGGSVYWAKKRHAEADEIIAAEERKLGRAMSVAERNHLLNMNGHAQVPGSEVRLDDMAVDRDGKQAPLYDRIGDSLMSAEDEYLETTDENTLSADMLADILQDGGGKVNAKTKALAWPALAGFGGENVRRGHLSRRRRAEIHNAVGDDIKGVVNSWLDGQDDERIDLVFEAAGATTPQARDLVMEHLDRPKDQSEVMWSLMLASADSETYRKRHPQYLEVPQRAPMEEWKAA